MNFPNLAGGGDRTAACRAELEAAKIPVYKMDRSKMEVSAFVVGRLNGWQFERHWYYWSARSKTPLPFELAKDLPNDTIRVNGDCTCPMPKGPVDSYHVDTVEGLALLAETIASAPAPDFTSADEIRFRLLTQSNECTAEPIFLVRQKRRITGVDTDYADDGQIIWIVDGEECNAEESAELEKRYDDSDEIGPEYTRTAFIEIDETVTLCFTKEAAERYIERNRHNLRKPFVYVDSLYRNPEMIAVRQMLLRDAR